MIIDKIISVIVPVYNAEKTIERCIESLLNSKCSNLEIILVDDGSTDHSGIILDRFAQEYDNVTSIHIPNGGISCARNCGIKQAQGKYITFVDADDYVSTDIYLKCCKIIMLHKPDMIEFGYSVQGMDRKSWEVSFNKIEKDRVLEREYILSNIVPRMINLNGNDDFFLNNFVWCKLFRRDIIEKFKIRFDEERKMWEDRVFQIEFLKYTQTFYLLPEYGYFYVQTEDSLSSKTDKRILYIIMKSYSLYRNLWKEQTNYDFENLWTVNYYCKILNENSIKICAKYEMSEIKEELKEFVKNENVQKLYGLFQPNTLFEVNMREVIKMKDIDELFVLCNKKAESLNKQKKFDKLKKIVIRVMNGIKRRIPF